MIGGGEELLCERRKQFFFFGGGRVASFRGGPGDPPSPKVPPGLGNLGRSFAYLKGNLSAQQGNITLRKVVRLVIKTYHSPGLSVENICSVCNEQRQKIKLQGRKSFEPQILFKPF